MTVRTQEIRVPVLPALQYHSPTHAIRLANETIYGLAASVWSAHIDRAVKVAYQIRAGTVWINDHHMISAEAPFGGYKQSGIGRELGTWGLMEYTEIKHIHADLSRTREHRFWYDILTPQIEA